MEPVTPLDWHRMFLGEEPPLYLLEIVVRITAIYLFAVVMMRVMGKRGQGQFSPFEYVVIIALGSATGDAMFYPEVPILYAWVVIAVVVLLDRLLAWMQTRSRATNRFVEGTPRLLVHDGQVLREALHDELIRPDELMGMLRENGVRDVGDVEYAFLERSGSLSVLCRRAGTPTTLPPGVGPAG